MRDGNYNAPRSFSELVRPHLERLYRLAYRLTGSPDDAQDLVQDVLFKLFPKYAELTDIEALLPWLAKVMYRQFIDNQRRYKVRHLHVVNDSPYAENPDLAPAVQVSTEDLVEAEFHITRVQAAMKKLNVDHQLIISLHDVEGYTISEIADITGVPLGTLKSRRQRARERLQELLEEGPK